MAKKKRWVVRIQNKDDLYCARAIVTMKEKTDKGSHYQDLRRGRPIQECWARFLHQEAGVPEGPWGFEELQKFRDYLGPLGYQLIMVEPSKCLIEFKDSRYNRAPHCIGLVKHQGHFDGLTSNPALINWSYCCHLCGKGYNTQDPSNITAKGRIALPVLESTKHVLIVLPGSNPLFTVRTILSCFMDKTVFRRCWTRSTWPILSNHAIADGGLIFFHFCA